MQQRPRFPQLWANSQALPRREGACPFRQGMLRYPPTPGEFANVYAFARDFPCRTVCCAERASPFPTMRFCEFAVGLWESRYCCGDRPRAGRRPLQGNVAYSPGIAVCLRCCCPARRVGAPYRETPAFSPGVPARPRSRCFAPVIYPASVKRPFTFSTAASARPGPRTGPPPAPCWAAYRCRCTAANTAPDSGC